MPHRFWAFAFIGFRHTEDVVICTTRCVAHNNHTPGQKAVADDARLTGEVMITRAHGERPTDAVATLS